MAAARSKNTVVNLVSLILASSVLTGCLEKQDNGFADRVGDPLTLTGSVGDGPIVNADVRVLSRRGDVLASLLSDSTANYSVTFDVADDEFPLIVGATGGTDIVTGLESDFRLESVVLSADEQSIANLNPFSTMIAALAEQMNGGLVAANMLSAEEIVVTQLNSGLKGIAASGVMRSAINDSNIAEMMKSSETLAEMFRRTSSLLNASGFTVSIDELIAVIASDLTDGVMDGRGEIGADPRTSAVATLVYAQVLLEAMTNELRVNGRNIAAAMNNAIEHVGTSPVTFVEDLTITDAMVAKVRVGLAAAYAVTQDPSLRDLHTTISGMRSGMEPTLIRSLMPSNFDTRMDAILGIIASSDNATIELVNEIARTDGAIAEGNRRPQIAGLPAMAVAPGSNYRFVPEATDPDGDVLNFQGANIPDWASFDTMTGTISGSPDNGDIGSYPGVAISVSDGELSDTLGPFTITVTTGNSPPEISGSPQRSVVAGDRYSFMPAASDPDDDALSFSISNKPAWASFDTLSGRLSGTPSDVDAGRYGNIVISVTDGDLTDSLAAFAIEVTTLNAPPTIGGSPPRTVTVGQAYSFTPTASDPDGDNLTFTVANLPSWAAFDASTGTVSGTPADADVGSYTGIRVIASDGTDTASLQWSVEVEAVSLGSLALSWTAPTRNADGTQLTDLAGYRIYWGRTSGNYTESVTVDNPGLTSYVVENLAPGTYEFVTRSFNTAGVESEMSEPATGTVP